MKANSINFFSASPPIINSEITLPAIDSWPETKHLFDEESIWAIRAALVAKRPLLLRGEAGIGKSQLARAAAEILKVPFLYFVVDERTEKDDLLYSYDAVSRLAEAQVSALSAKEDSKNWRNLLGVENFIQPGVLWWAFQWQEALKQDKRYYRVKESSEKRKPGTGSVSTVVLIDEIDKADPSVPNGLLECLGNDGFTIPQLRKTISLSHPNTRPFVIITTNEERELSPAFLRRCVVHQMRLPKAESEMIDFLTRRAEAVIQPFGVDLDLIPEIVHQLRKHRESIRDERASKPGASEFLDLLKMLNNLPLEDKGGQKEVLEKVKNFVFMKNLN